MSVVGQRVVRRVSSVVFGQQSPSDGVSVSVVGQQCSPSDDVSVSVVGQQSPSVNVSVSSSLSSLARVRSGPRSPSFPTNKFEYAASWSSFSSATQQPPSAVPVQRSRRPALYSGGLRYSVRGPPQQRSISVQVPVPPPVQQRSSPSSVQVPPVQRSGRRTALYSGGHRYSVRGPSSNSVPTEFEFDNGGNDLANSVPTEFEFDNGGNDLANSVPTENDCKFVIWCTIVFVLYCIVFSFEFLTFFSSYSWYLTYYFRCSIFLSMDSHSSSCKRGSLILSSSEQWLLGFNLDHGERAVLSARSNFQVFGACQVPL